VRNIGIRTRVQYIARMFARATHGKLLITCRNSKSILNAN